MYKSHHIVFGFHGCDKQIGEKVIQGTEFLKESKNNFDWLGHGIYFWENDPKRALEYAKQIKKSPKIETQEISDPFVVGAVIDLGYCLNLLDRENLELLEMSYKLYSKFKHQAGDEIPVNSIPFKDGEGFYSRKLDCDVINFIHTFNGLLDRQPYDSVRGVFWEEEQLYPSAGFRKGNHIQIAVRNPNSIKGFFHPRSFNADFSRP